MHFKQKKWYGKFHLPDLDLSIFTPNVKNRESIAKVISRVAKAFPFLDLVFDFLLNLAQRTPNLLGKKIIFAILSFSIEEQLSLRAKLVEFIKLDVNLNLYMFGVECGSTANQG
jgi:hypothetical protein